MAKTIAEVYAALSDSTNLEDAAKKLAMTPFKLKAIIKANPQLLDHLSGSSIAPAVFKEAGLSGPISADKEADAMALSKSDKNIRKGLENIGVSGKSLDQALAFRSFGAAFFHDTRHMLGGGIAKLFCDLMAQHEADTALLSTPAVLVDPEMQRIIREDRSRTTKHLVDVFDRANQASLTQAIIEQKKRERGDKKQNAVPAFPPLTIGVVGGNVTVVEGKESGKGSNNSPPPAARNKPAPPPAVVAQRNAIEAMVSRSPDPEHNPESPSPLSDQDTRQCA